MKPCRHSRLFSSHLARVVVAVMVSGERGKTEGLPGLRRELDPQETTKT